MSYYGGKQSMASHILPHLPPHTVYVEPFAGGAALLFAKPRRVVTNRDHYREVLNDTNDLLITLYRVAQTNLDELVLKISGTLYSQSEYRRALDICRNPGRHDNISIAWAVYVNLQMSFAKKLNGGWGVASVRGTPAHAWTVAVDNITERCERLKGVHISAEDALACIKRWDSPQTCFYLDPPYLGTHCGHYEGYSADEFMLLIDTLKSISGSFVLSCYEKNFESDAEWRRVEIERQCHSSGQGKVGDGRDKTRVATSEELGNRTRTEILWICDRSATMRPELQRVLKIGKFAAQGDLFGEQA